MSKVTELENALTTLFRKGMLTSRRQAAATRRISTSPMMPSASAAQKQSFGQIWRLCTLLE